MAGICPSSATSESCRPSRSHAFQRDSPRLLPWAQLAERMLLNQQVRASAARDPPRPRTLTPPVFPTPQAFRPTWLVLHHLLPNAVGPIITQSSMNLSWAILNAAGLSFLGLNVQPPTPEWGVMISEGAPYIVSGQWWMALFPGAALMLLTAGFILIGDGLNAGAER
jgi:hypothetical protein